MLIQNAKKEKTNFKNDEVGFYYFNGKYLKLSID